MFLIAVVAPRYMFAPVYEGWFITDISQESLKVQYLLGEV